MKKRILSGFLSILLIVTILPVTVFGQETSAMTVSQEGLNLIKEFEGFTSDVMSDGHQWAIGYGNACDPADYPDGITPEEAEALLRESMVYFEDCVNQYLNQYGITLSQNEFDALVSITYNLGPSWINSSYRFWTMLRNGLGNYTDNQIASAIGVWCHVGSAVNTSILQRRIREIQVFLYGDYTGASSPTFQYLIFQGNGGSVETDVMLYRSGEPYLEFPEATREGYHFAGWYTAKDGGTQITANSAASANYTVYAQWSADPVDAPETDGLYADVSSEDWFYAYVSDLSEEGVISGYQDGTYRPHADATAGQALKLILLAAGYSEQAPTGSHWASGYLQLALDEGIVQPGEITDLNGSVSRLLTAKITCNALGLSHAEGESVFADTADGCAMALYHAGILEGSLDSATGNRIFEPNDTLNRAEIAKIVWMVEQYG